ncbi:hypothetical protein K466DRAFT_383319 [Polyporus arcularius HHB13444]|uniref:Uncharacterized protein n=1 Tax=Polyporus arcularius HHB13444 TaxID=1314778 RepID=A0A5C3NUB8_9APHY|nr:hypothetical protein K466DRAFT_383319 [Polyporus arcularius HHB13444]
MQGHAVLVAVEEARGDLEAGRIAANHPLAEDGIGLVVDVGWAAHVGVVLAQGDRQVSRIPANHLLAASQDLKMYVVSAHSPMYTVGCHRPDGGCRPVDGTGSSRDRAETRSGVGLQTATNLGEDDLCGRGMAGKTKSSPRLNDTDVLSRAAAYTFAWSTICGTGLTSRSALVDSL